MAFLAQEAKTKIITVVVAKLSTTSTNKISEVLEMAVRLANESFVGLHQGAVVVELVKLILEIVKISAEREILLHEDAVIDASDQLGIVNRRRWLQDL